MGDVTTDNAKAVTGVKWLMILMPLVKILGIVLLIMMAISMALMVEIKMSTLMEMIEI